MRSPVQRYLEELHARFVDDCSGEVATYIPELGLGDPDRFGICLTTADGHAYEVGDTRDPFTIQSMSKPFAYALALADRGREAVAAKVGVEPSGDAFNSISLAPGTGRPLNPMINAGAITTTALVAGADDDARFERILAAFSRFAGRPLDVDEAVFASERRTGHRNRAIGHMLRSFDILGDDPDRTLDEYFRQCSIAVDARDVSLMAATLANGGVNPVTGEQACGEEVVERVLSVMTTCGMYDGSGAWFDAVGLPAKSGVAGGVLAVLPGQLGVCVFSPRLDEHGNSVRGMAACRALAEGLHLHSLHVARSARSTIRSSYDVAAVPSRRRRPDAQAAALLEVGTRAVVYELQGDLLFAGTEHVVRTIVERADELDVVLLDLRAVDRVEVPAALALQRLGTELAAAGKALGFVTAPGLDGLVLEAGAHLGSDAPTFADLDEAREWCEGRLLEPLGLCGLEGRPVALADHRLCRGLDPASIETLAAALTERTGVAGETIAAIGDVATAIHLVLAGEVAIQFAVADGTRRRLALLGPGETFGELAALGGSPRRTDVVVARDATLLALEADALERLGETDPHLKARLLRNLLAGADEGIGRMSREIAAILGA